MTYIVSGGALNSTQPTIIIVMGGTHEYSGTPSQYYTELYKQISLTKEVKSQVSTIISNNSFTVVTKKYICLE